MKKKNAEIHIYLSAEQKELITRLAELRGKKRSEFLMEAAFAADQNQSDQSVAVDDHQPEILRLLRESQKMQYILVRLVLRIGAEQLSSVDEIMKYFRECQKDADEKYGEG